MPITMLDRALLSLLYVRMENMWRGGLPSVVSHKSDFGNQEITQLELWNLEQWDILSLVPGKLLWRKCIRGLGAKINQLINRHLCEITGGPPPLSCITYWVKVFHHYQEKFIILLNVRAGRGTSFSQLGWIWTIEIDYWLKKK